jgi:hypothetical protein
VGGTKELAERGEKAQAGVPHLQEATTVEVQELPARPRVAGQPGENRVRLGEGVTAERDLLPAPPSHHAA